MATNHSVIAFEYLNISDDVILGTRYSVNASDNLILVGSSNNFDHYKVSNDNDNIDIDDISQGVISQYIKKIFGDNIDITDNAIQRVDYQGKAYGEENNDIHMEDDSICHMFTPQNASENLSLSTRGYIDVNYNGVYGNPSNMALIDSVIGIVSRNYSKTFKNSLYELLGTVEQTLYTCTTKTATILNISIVNMIGTTVLVDVILYKGGTLPMYITKGTEILTLEKLIINKLNNAPIILEKDDELRIVTDTVISSDIYIALCEQS